MDLYSGYFPGLIGQIATLHACTYHQAWGFDASFEIQVATELAAFIGSFDATRDGIWSLRDASGQLVGAVAIDGWRAGDQGARLRWFIVRPSHCGQGLGQRLLREALGFCRQRRFARVFLWTFAGLDAARRLYERAGFRLCAEHPATQWGQTIREQQFCAPAAHLRDPDPVGR
jgi:GNAT superfamily N-acetyltransferase